MVGLVRRPRARGAAQRARLHRVRHPQDAAARSAARAAQPAAGKSPAARDARRTGRVRGRAFGQQVHGADRCIGRHRGARPCGARGVGCVGADRREARDALLAAVRPRGVMVGGTGIEPVTPAV